MTTMSEKANVRGGRIYATIIRANGDIEEVGLVSSSYLAERVYIKIRDFIRRLLK